MRMPVEVFLDKLIKNRSLADAISQHFFRGTPTFFAMSYFSLYLDYFYPKGGVGEIPRRIEEKLVELGGEVRKKTDITRVDLVRKCVVDQNGEKYSYDRLVWAADLKQLYRIIATDGLSEKRARRVMEERARILSKRGAESVFTVFMGVDLSPELFEEISRPHFFYTPHRAGLGTLQRDDLKLMLDAWSSVSKDQVLAWLDDFIRLNTLEISVPVLSDPDAAPVGKTGVIASLLFEYELVKRVSADAWYDEFESHVENRIVDLLSGSIYPGLRDHLLFTFSAGPLSIEKRVRSSEGAIVGWSLEEPVPIDPGILNMKNAVRTALPDVLKVGQWAASPAGIPTCILTAKLAADTIYKEIS
jgi:phytoene dehydrogenase-like protein